MIAKLRLGDDEPIMCFEHMFILTNGMDRTNQISIMKRPVLVGIHYTSDTSKHSIPATRALDPPSHSSIGEARR